MNEKESTAKHAILDVYFCNMEHCEPGHAFGPAIRPHYLLHVILDGKGIYQKGGKTYHLEKGCAFLIPPMESTFYQADLEDPWTYAWIGFDGKACSDILAQTVFSDSCIFRSSSKEQTEQIIFHMKTLLEKFYASWESSLEPMGNLLLLLSCMSHPHVAANQPFSTQYFVKAKEYIENNYTYP
ncbi:transcriptional regulator, AraC family, partial [gut metagenome]